MPSEGAAAALATQVSGGGGLEVPSDYQMKAAGEFAERLGKRRREHGAPVRTVFVADEEVDKPPLAKLLSSGAGGGGGRGGQLRVKLYVSLLWVCAKAPYDAVRPAVAWAALLGLDDPAGRGVRRIQDTLKELEDRQMVALAEKPGHHTKVVLLNERGDGSAYRPPSDVHSQLASNGADDAALREHRYFRIPSSVWTGGHIADLSGPGIAMLLALLSEQRGRAAGPVWFSPSRATARFRFAPSTRSKGLGELQRLDLVETSTKVISESGAFIDFSKRRHVHEVVGL